MAPSVRWRMKYRVCVVENVLWPDGYLQIASPVDTNDPAGYGGFVLWRQEDPTAVWVRIYPHRGGLWVGDYVDGVGRTEIYGGVYEDFTWYKLRVDADSEMGILEVYVNDVHQATYTVTTPFRSGLTGLHSGNSAGGFDNFKLSSPGGGKKR